MKKILLVLLLVILTANPIYAEETKENPDDGLVANTPTDVVAGEKIENPIVISQTNYEILLSESLQINYSLNVETEAVVTFTSSDPSVATVTPKGYVNTLSTGNTVITVSIEIDGVTHQKNLNVRVFTYEGKVEFQFNAIRLNRASSYKLEYTLSNDKISNSDIIWASSNPKVATVENGVVKGLTLGKTIINATVGKNTSSIEVNVIAPLVEIKFNPTEVSVTVDSSVEIPSLIYVPFDSTGIEEPVYTTENTDIIKIEGNKIVGLKTGVATVTATIDKITTTLKVNVEAHTDANGAQIASVNGVKDNNSMVFSLKNLLSGSASKYAVELSVEDLRKAVSENLDIVIKIPNLSSDMRRIQEIIVPIEEFDQESVHFNTIKVISDNLNMSYTYVFSESLDKNIDIALTMNKANSKSKFYNQVDGLTYELVLNANNMPENTKVSIPTKELDMQNTQIQFIYSINNNVVDANPQSVTVVNDHLEFDVTGNQYLIASKALSNSNDNTAIIVLAGVLGVVLLGAGVVYIKRMKIKQVWYNGKVLGGNYEFKRLHCNN